MGIKVKFSTNTSPLILKNQRPSGALGNLKDLADVDMTGAANNGVVNDLDGGEF
jgi:hypothetical protein